MAKKIEKKYTAQNETLIIDEEQISGLMGSRRWSPVGAEKMSAEGASEEALDAMDEAMDDAADALDDAVDEAADAMDKALDDATDALDEAFDDLGL